jgi:hypothetical protein
MNHTARNYIQSEPVVALKAGLTLAGRFWSLVPLNTQDRRLPPLVRLAIGSFYALIFGGALVGLVRILRGEWRRWWPLLALVAGFTLVHSVYWSDMRMRAPLEPVICLLAAASVAKGANRLPSR